jgi:hypothetical protein
VLRFPTPTVGRPKAVASAAADFDTAADRYARTAGEVKSSDAAIAAAQALDQSEYIERLRKDDSAVHARNHESDALLEQAAAERKLEALATLADESGDALARAIGEHKGEWLDELRKAGDAAAADYDRQVAELEASLTRLVELKSGIAWLEKFETGAAITFDMNRLDVRYRVASVPQLFMKINPKRGFGARLEGRPGAGPRLRSPVCRRGARRAQGRHRRAGDGRPGEARLMKAKSGHGGSLRDLTPKSEAYLRIEKALDEHAKAKAAADHSAEVERLASIDDAAEEAGKS